MSAPEILSTDKIAQNFIGLCLMRPNDFVIQKIEFVKIMDNFLAEINQQFKFRDAEKVNELVDIILETKNRFNRFSYKVNNANVFCDYIHEEVFLNALKKRMPKIYEIFTKYKPIIIKPNGK